MRVATDLEYEYLSKKRGVPAEAAMMGGTPFNIRMTKKRGVNRDVEAEKHCCSKPEFS